MAVASRRPLLPVNHTVQPGTNPSTATCPSYVSQTSDDDDVSILSVLPLPQVGRVSE